MQTLKCAVLAAAAALTAGADPPPLADDAAIAALVEALGHDDTKWNAIKARWALEEIGERARPALEAALRSDDWQRRQGAADVLRHIDPPDPSDALLRVTVEGLADDGTPYPLRGARTDGRTIDVSNAASGMRFLLLHAERAEPLLIEGLRSDDAQQRFVCAFVLGGAGRAGAAEEIAATLLPHLRDNDIEGDAVMAAWALHGLGEAVVPLLRTAAPTADRQQRELITLIAWNLGNPTPTDAELRARSRLNSVSECVHDPISEFRLGRTPFRWDRR